MPGQIVSGQLLVISKGVIGSFRVCSLRGALICMWCTPPTRGRVDKAIRAVHAWVMEVSVGGRAWLLGLGGCMMLERGARAIESRPGRISKRGI